MTLATPAFAALYMAMLFMERSIVIDLGNLVVLGALCAWFADVERRRGWVRKVKARSRTR